MNPAVKLWQLSYDKCPSVHCALAGNMIYAIHSMFGSHFFYINLLVNLVDE
jgi:hypothetical protein